jgi:lipid-binding SYLF domain-containing protein
MKNYVISLVSACILLLGSLCSAAEIQDFSRTLDNFKQSPQVQQYFDHSFGYVVFPTVGKGAFLVGFAHGKGQVYRRGYVTGTSALYHFSIGLQAGGQAFSEIIFFQDQRAYEEFVRGGFEFDAKAAAVAVTAGVSAQAGSTGNSTSVSAGPTGATQHGPSYVKGLAVFVQSKGGLLAEAALGMQRITYAPLAAPPAAIEVE